MNPSLPSTLPDPPAREQRQVSQAGDAFFRAWKRGVEIAGPEWFGDGTREGLQGAAGKWDLCPRIAQMRKCLSVLSGGERLFLAALASFYDGRDGGALLKRCGFQGLADLGGLDPARRRVIADLLLHYEGW